MSTDLERRLSAYRPTLDEAISDDLAARNSVSVASVAGLRRPRFTVAICSAAAASLLAAGVMVWSSLRSDDSRHVVVSPPDTAAPTSAVDSVPVTAVPLSPLESANATGDSAVVPAALPDLLGAVGTGLYLDPVPDGLSIDQVSEYGDQELGGGGSREQIAVTSIVKYNADRSRVVDAVTIDVYTRSADLSVAAQHPNAVPTALVIDGSAVYIDAGPRVTEVVWEDADHYVRVVGSPELDLLKIAAGLVARPDGSFDATVVPDGFEQVSVLPGWISQHGPAWTTSYEVDDPNGLTARPAVTLELDANPAKSAEDFLVDFRGFINGQAVDEGGRRMIVAETSPGAYGDTQVIWDLADGTQAKLTYSPDNEAPAEQKINEALELARHVQRANGAHWKAIQDAAFTRNQLFLWPSWLAPALLAQDAFVAGGGLVAGDTRNVLIAPAMNADGSGQRACEFVDQTLNVCTFPETAIADGATGTATIVGGYVRVVSAKAATARIDAGTPFATPVPLSPLFPDWAVTEPFTAALDVKVGYLTAPTEQIGYVSNCVYLYDADGQLIGSLPISGLPATECIKPS